MNINQPNLSSSNASTKPLEWISAGAKSNSICRLAGKNIFSSKRNIIIIFSSISISLKPSSNLKMTLTTASSSTTCFYMPRAKKQTICIIISKMICSSAWSTNLISSLSPSNRDRSSSYGATIQPIIPSNNTLKSALRNCWQLPRPTTKNKSRPILLWH